MTERRVVIGKRGDGTYGVFVSKPGFDALSAADANLSLNISAKVSSLILLGQVSSSQTISLGLTRSPIVLVTSQNNLSNLPAYSGSPGPARPSPMFRVIDNGDGSFHTELSPASSVTINGNGASMTITCGASTVYAVYSTAFT